MNKCSSWRPIARFTWLLYRIENSGGLDFGLGGFGVCSDKEFIAGALTVVSGIASEVDIVGMVPEIAELDVPPGPALLTEGRLLCKDGPDVDDGVIEGFKSVKGAETLPGSNFLLQS